MIRKMENNQQRKLRSIQGGLGGKQECVALKLKMCSEEESSVKCW